jgi:hypothetical protein
MRLNGKEANMNNSIIIRSVLFLFLAIGLGGCSASRVKTDVDPAAKISVNNYSTFKFTDSDDQAGPNPLYHSALLDNSIHAEIAIQLQRRGIREDLINPDMLIAYHTYTEKKQSAVNNYYPMMYGGWAWRFYPWGFAPYPFGYWNGYYRTYTEGTLIIDAIDAKTKQLIWRGSISDAVDDPGNLHNKVVKAVEIIFKKFPIKPGASPLRSNGTAPIASNKG